MVNIFLKRVFREIGLTPKHAAVYETLLTHPLSTPLSLSRKTTINRSTLYRYLEELRESGLAEYILTGKSGKYRADPHGLELYLTKEEARVTRLKKEVPTLIKKLTDLSRQESQTSQVKYFRGGDGLKQMLWNVVRAKGEFVGLGYEDWNTSVGKAYAEKLRAKMMERGLVSREIQNDPSSEFDYTELGGTYQKYYSHRAIEPAILEIKHDTYIYDEVFAYYYHLNGEYFGVEIHNAAIAKTEKQMFEILWKMAVEP